MRSCTLMAPPRAIARHDERRTMAISDPPEEGEAQWGGPVGGIARVDGEDEVEQKQGPENEEVKRGG